MQAYSLLFSNLPLFTNCCQYFIVSHLWYNWTWFLLWQSVPTYEIKLWFINNSAFNNQCVKCKYKKNPLHFSKKNNLGVNQSSKDTPFYCLKCKSLLPRPVTKKDGKIKIMRGFTSAYKRMDWLKPASTITRNFPYVCSDNKIHPNQNSL